MHLLFILYLYRITNIIALTNQSIVIAIHTPSTPSPSHLAITTLAPILNIHIDKIATIIVNITSFAARSELGNANENGHIVQVQIA